MNVTKKMPPGTRFGEIAATLGYCTPEQANEAARLQKEDARYKGKLIGEVMVAEGYINPRQQERAVNVQKEMRERLDAMEDPSSLTPYQVTDLIKEVDRVVTERESIDCCAAPPVEQRLQEQGAFADQSESLLAESAQARQSGEHLEAPEPHTARVR